MGSPSRIDDVTAYVGLLRSEAAIALPSSIIVVEVLALSTRHIDLSAKLAGNLRLPSIARYLIVGPERPRIVHRARATGGTILTRIINEGSIQLGPPRIENRND